MIKYIIGFAIFYSISSWAGGDFAPAKVKNFEKQSEKITLVEIEWVKEKGFIANNNETKLKFQLHEWPDTSFFVKNILSLFYDPFEKQYPKAKFNECLTFMEQKFKNKEIFNLGQMGTVEFRKDKNNPEYIVVPYADLATGHSDSTACYLYAAPI